MPQNTDCKDTNSETPAKSYRNRLNGWAIARSVPNTEKIIVARFRTRSDADGYVQHLRQLIPEGNFEVIFDCHREEAVL